MKTNPLNFYNVLDIAYFQITKKSIKYCSMTRYLLHEDNIMFHLKTDNLGVSLWISGSFPCVLAI